MDPLGFGKIIAENWDILKMYPGAFLSVLGFGFIVGLAITRVFLNERLTRHVWSGRALQEDFVEWAAAVLHQCIRPLIGARCAPGHHGYQRACDLVNGQASIGPFGSPVFARARKTDPPSRLILSQTSAGKGCWLRHR